MAAMTQSWCGCASLQTKGNSCSCRRYLCRPTTPIHGLLPSSSFSCSALPHVLLLLFPARCPPLPLGALRSPWQHTHGAGACTAYRRLRAGRSRQMLAPPRLSWVGVAMGDRERRKVPSPAAPRARSLPLSGEHPPLVFLPPLSPPFREHAAESCL